MKQPTYTFIADLAGYIPETPPDSIVSRTIFDDAQARGVLFSFAAGQELSEHTASQPAILHFVQGEAEITLGGDGKQVQAGTWVHMPPKLPHSIQAQTPLTMLLLLLKSS